MIWYEANVPEGQKIKRYGWLSPDDATGKTNVPVLRFSDIQARVTNNTNAYDDPDQANSGYSIFYIPSGTNVTVLARYINKNNVRMVYVETQVLKYVQKGGNTETLYRKYRTFIPESSISY